jgi:putative membrane protein
MYKRRRVLGTYLGLALATLLPGVSAVDGPAWEGVVLGGFVFVVLNQLIYTYPSDIRNAHPVPLLTLAAIGIVQDTLIWLIFSWLSSKMEWGLHVAGFLTALLAGVIARVSVLALLPFGPQSSKEAS